MTYLRPDKMIENVVGIVSTNLTGKLKWTNGNAITQVAYMSGHPYEIIQLLNDLTKSEVVNSKKYPMICLFTDFTETSAEGYLCEANLHIIIASVTKPEYNKAQRDIENFIPILQPIYDEFIAQIKRSNYFGGFYNVPGDKTNRYFWGKNGLFGQDNVKFSDFIDCIEIQNFNLKVKEVSGDCTLITNNIH